MAEFPDAERRRQVADELSRVLIQAEFRGGDELLKAVIDWIGMIARKPPPRPCMVCARSLSGLVVESGAIEPRLLLGRNAGARAVCGPCIYLALDALDVEGVTSEQRQADAARPRWDMLRAELERALALLSEEDAAVARACLAARPHRAEAECGHCRKAKPCVVGRGGHGLCGDCARSARSTYTDIGLRSELERGDTNCPECGSEDVAAAPMHIEFTVMTCLACGHSETCDVWQLMEWHG